MSEARATLARSRGGNDEFRDRAAEPLSAPERRPRGGGLPRGRTPPPPPPAPAPPPDALVPTWAEERADILDALRALSDLCETLAERITEIQKRPWHAAYQAMAKWADAERTAIAEQSQTREPEPLDLPPLRSLRQN